MPWIHSLPPQQTIPIVEVSPHEIEIPKGYEKSPIPIYVANLTSSYLHNVLVKLTMVSGSLSLADAQIIPQSKQGSYLGRLPRNDREMLQINELFMASLGTDAKGNKAICFATDLIPGEIRRFDLSFKKSLTTEMIHSNTVIFCSFCGADTNRMFGPAVAHGQWGGDITSANVSMPFICSSTFMVMNISRKPTAVAPFLERAAASFASNDTDQAIADYTDALRVQPDAFEALCNRSALYIQKREFKLALQDSTNAICISQNLSVPYINLATCYAQMGMHSNAVSILNSAIRLDPDLAIAYQSRGSSHYILGHYKEAIADFSAAVTRSNTLSDAWRGRASACENQKDFLPAIADYTQVIRLSPSNSTAWLGRGRCHAQVGAFRQAIADYTRAICINTNNAEAFFCRGCALYVTRQRFLGNYDFAAALRIAPSLSNQVPPYVNTSLFH